jgi:hypothetical protein
VCWELTVRTYLNKRNRGIAGSEAEKLGSFAAPS